MKDDETVTYEASLGEPTAGEPARLYVWVRRFQDGEELTGRYEVFDDLVRLDGFIARAAAAGADVAALHDARRRFADRLGKAG